MIKSNLSGLTLLAFALASVLLQAPRAEGGQEFAEARYEDSSKTPELGTGKFASFPFKVSVSVRGGYDDNVDSSSFDTRESFFTSGSVGVTYDFGSPRTRITLNSGAGVTYYFDDDNDFDSDFDDGNSSDDYDFNVFLSLGVTHKATPRLTFAASIFATYQSEPNFDTFNAGIGLTRQSRDFFYTVDKFSVSYLWTPRFSTATSYTFGHINYDDELISDFEDRFEHTFGNEFRFLVMPTTTLVAEYRFGFIDYINADNRNSTSHFLLGGIDHSFNPRFNASVRAGVEFREFDGGDDDDDDFDPNTDGSRTQPYFEGTVNYAIAQTTAVTLTGRYSLEQPDVPEAFSRTTFRTSLQLRHAFTARISSTLGVAYQHDDNQGSFAVDGFNEDSFDLLLGVRYTIARNWALDAGYQHIEVVSDEALFRDFSRNRYFAGATFSF